ncbi:MAG: nuclear transport factor 2 family protein [Acidobacteria bacterium]|nr:nuclear transport factor 2 family protein [Acidobacteriota bacterium]
MFSTIRKCLLALTLAVSLGAVAPALAEELTAEDHAQIHQLYARYVQAIDFGEAVAWADTFTPEGSFGDAVTGRDALIAFADDYHEENGDAPRHWYGALVLTPTAEGAEGRCYAVTFNSRTQSLMWTGTYRDTLVKTADGWRFSQRQLTIDPTGGE